MNNPKISVIMPFYNCEKFLDEAVSSILNQTFSDFELIIINDASTDRSDEVMQKYLKDSRIVYILNKENKRITYNLNIGLDMAKADIVARMDGDDISELERFQEQYEFLKENKNVSLVGSYAELINQDGKYLGRKIKPLDTEGAKKDIFLYSPFIHPAVMFRKQVILDLGKYDENYPLCEDYELWFRLIYSGYKTANIPRELLKYRIHENSSNKHLTEVEKNNLKIRKKAFKKYGLRVTFRKLFFMCVHYILGISVSGRKKQKMELLYKKIFYGE
jgi:glycosyltransferase involved in cell wall biosynthesis